MRIVTTLTVEADVPEGSDASHIMTAALRAIAADLTNTAPLATPRDRGRVAELGARWRAVTEEQR